MDCSAGLSDELEHERLGRMSVAVERVPFLIPFLFDGMAELSRRILMGSFWLAAGEVLFAEVLVTPTGVSKGCG